MVEMMERYQSHLEDLVAERTDALEEEKKKTENLLHRMLPKFVFNYQLNMKNTYLLTTCYDHKGYMN